MDKNAVTLFLLLVREGFAVPDGTLVIQKFLFLRIPITRHPKSRRFFERILYKIPAVFGFLIEKKARSRILIFIMGLVPVIVIPCFVGIDNVIPFTVKGSGCAVCDILNERLAGYFAI
jgi:hypothetical protein